MSARSLMVMAATLGALAVLLGALGAHALKVKLDPAQLASFETGVRYQMYHALALLLCAVLVRQGMNGLTPVAIFFLVGVALFSGSIYLLATRDLTGLTSWRWLGPVTPLGGVCLIAGWLALLVAALRKG